VRSAIDDFNRGDFTAFAAIFHPDVEQFADPQVADRSEYRGREGLMDWIAEAQARWRGVRFHGISVREAGEHTLVELGVVGEAYSGGGAWRIYVLLRWQDDLIESLRAYPSRDDALADAGAPTDR
jgi:ketosteroid isomerase-like protein